VIDDDDNDDDDDDDVRYAGRQRYVTCQGESRDESRDSSPETEHVGSSRRPSRTSSQSHGSDSSKPPPIAAKPRVRNTGQ